VAIPSCWSWSLIFVLDLKLGGSDPCITAISQLKSQYSIAQARYWRVMSRMKSTLMILTRPISQLVVRPQNALDLSSAEHRSHTASSLHCTNRSVPQSLFTTTPFHNPIDNQLNMSFPIIRGNETRVSSCEGIVNYTFTDKNHLLQALNNAGQGPSPSIQQLRQHVRQK
jgi:hypothetical protein